MWYTLKTRFLFYFVKLLIFVYLFVRSSKVQFLLCINILTECEGHLLSLFSLCCRCCAAVIAVHFVLNIVVFCRKIFDYPMLLVLMTSVSVMLSLLDTFNFPLLFELLTHPTSSHLRLNAR